MPTGLMVASRHLVTSTGACLRVTCRVDRSAFKTHLDSSAHTSGGKTASELLIYRFVGSPHVSGPTEVAERLGFGLLWRHANTFDLLEGLYLRD